MLVSRYCRGLNSGPFFLSMNLYGPNGAPELDYEPMLVEGVAILGRTVDKMGRLVMEGRFKGMGLLLSGTSLIPLMGFLSSYELDAVSWALRPCQPSWDGISWHWNPVRSPPIFAVAISPVSCAAPVSPPSAMRSQRHRRRRLLGGQRFTTPLTNRTYDSHLNN